MRQHKYDTGLLVPVLPQTGPSENVTTNGASFLGVVLNISTTIIGAGIMSIPATIKVLGIIPGFIAILIVAYFVEVTVEFMLRYSQSGQATTYAGLMGVSFGSSGSISVQICVIITNLGCLIIYLIIIDVLCGNQSGEKLHLGILQEWFGVHWWNSRAFALLFLVLFVMLPVVLLRRVDSLKYTSGISILLAVVFIAISSTMAIYAIWQGKTQKLRLFPDFVNHTSLLDLFTTIPVFVTGLGFHINVHPIRAELVKPSDMNSAVRFSLIICIALYFAIGFTGYLLFGDSIMPDILFMGSTTIVVLSFIFPGLIILRDVHGISTRRDRIMAISVIFLAAGTSFVAIYTNLKSSDKRSSSFSAFLVKL